MGEEVLSLVSGTIGVVLVGAYQVTRIICEGGMGKVYEGLHLRLNKKVAIKVMSRQMAANQEALARFHREAEITSHLGHPNLVNVMDFGISASGEPFIVMEYLEGEDLEHRLRRSGHLPLTTVVHLTRQIASALAAAHDQGIVHRDLKPANIFLMQVPGEPDFVKILDFGISKIRAVRTQITQATAILGTPNYMAPEQANGQVDLIDHRADQWALACIVWEMLSGRVPFVADDVTALFYQITNLNPQPLRGRVPDLPIGVEEVLARALTKNIPDRFDSVRDFSRELENACLTPMPSPTPKLGTALSAAPVTPSNVSSAELITPPHRWRAWVLYVAAAWVGAFLVLAIPKLVRRKTPAPPTPTPYSITRAAPTLPDLQKPAILPPKAATRAPSLASESKFKRTKIKTLEDPFENYEGGKRTLQPGKPASDPNAVERSSRPAVELTRGQGNIIREL